MGKTPKLMKMQMFFSQILADSAATCLKTQAHELQRLGLRLLIEDGRLLMNEVGRGGALFVFPSAPHPAGWLVARPVDCCPDLSASGTLAIICPVLPAYFVGSCGHPTPDRGCLSMVRTLIIRNILGRCITLSPLKLQLSFAWRPKKLTIMGKTHPEMSS